MKYRDVEYSWSKSDTSGVERSEGIVVRGQAPTEAKAIAEVERVIDRAKAAIQSVLGATPEH